MKAISKPLQLSGSLREAPGSEMISNWRMRVQFMAMITPSESGRGFLFHLVIRIIIRGL